MTKENFGAEFLHSRNPSIYQSDEAQAVFSYLNNNGEHIGSRPSDTVAAYLGFLADPEYINYGLMTGDKESIKRQVEAYVIQPDQVPDSYFELELRIARERGMGYISELSEDEKSRLTEIVQEDQRSSLHKWAGYLGSQPSSIYPDWFKLYAFEGVLKLGQFDKERGRFNKRTSSTVAPFAELNPEALAGVKDALIAHQNGHEVEDGELQKLVEGGNFGKLYANRLSKVTNRIAEQLNIIDGSWVRYEQIEGDYDTDYEQFDDGEFAPGDLVDNPTANKLAESLHEYQTGWCTASYTTAAVQLSGGDFYVYYSQDEGGNDTVPRIALRTEGGQVVEVSGIDPGQQIEPTLIDVVQDKLIELGQEQYLDQVADMKRLTEIDNRVREGGELTGDDILWLRYSKIQPIGGWYGDEDPRIDKILHGRDKNDDIKIIAGAVDLGQVCDTLLHSDKVETNSSFFIELQEIVFDNLDIFLERVDSCTFIQDLYDSVPYQGETDDTVDTKIRMKRHRANLDDLIYKNFSTLLYATEDIAELADVLIKNEHRAVFENNMDTSLVEDLMERMTNGSGSKEFAEYLTSIGQQWIVLEYDNKFEGGGIDYGLIADQEYRDHYGEDHFTKEVDEYYS